MLNFHFHPHLIETVIGGLSAIDITRLEIQDLEQAYRFIKAYGYDLDLQADLDQVWSYHRRAISLIREELLNEGESIPPELTDPTLLQDVGYLLVYASAHSTDEKSVPLQRWSCAILRVMHTFAHIDNDLFSNYSEEIQDQMIKPFRDHMLTDAITGTTLGLSTDMDQIPLHRFDVKSLKTRSSAVIKLLSKPQTVAFNLLDKIGVRIVTKNVLDAFRVVRFLHRENIISFPNIMPDQSRNTLYPMNLLLEILNSTPMNTSNEQLQELMVKKLEDSAHQATYLEKPNEFSSENYRVIKFIARKLIEIKVGDKDIHFFYPLEVQVMDYENYLKTLSGPGSHQEYKKRQRDAARKRVLGTLVENKM